jgi:dsDNA-specific endonuclease/ATPase MutS2
MKQKKKKKSCQKVVKLSNVSQKLSKSCQNLSKNNQKVVEKLSKKCQKVVKKVQKSSVSKTATFYTCVTFCLRTTAKLSAEGLESTF